MLQVWFLSIPDVKYGGNCLTKIADPDKYGYSGYGIGFNARSQFLLLDGSCGKNVIVFRYDNSSSAHVDNKKKDILVLSEGPKQRLDNTKITTAAIYSINFTEPRKRFLLSLHYNESNSLLFVNATKKIPI